MKIHFYYLQSKTILEFEKYQEKLQKQINSFLPIEIKSLKGKAKKDVFLNYIRKQDYLILFDERGLSMNSVEFSKKMSFLLERPKKIIFLIGSDEGFSESIYKRADEKIRISNFTLNQSLARLLALEQIYRSLSILNNHPYHHK